MSEMVWYGPAGGVQVAAVRGDDGQDEEVLIRDGAHPELEPLRYTMAEWRAFVQGVEAGELRF